MWSRWQCEAYTALIYRFLGSDLLYAVHGWQFSIVSSFPDLSAKRSWRRNMSIFHGVFLSHFPTPWNPDLWPIWWIVRRFGGSEACHGLDKASLGFFGHRLVEVDLECIDMNSWAVRALGFARNCTQVKPQITIPLFCFARTRFVLLPDSRGTLLPIRRSYGNMPQPFCSFCLLVSLRQEYCLPDLLPQFIVMCLFPSTVQSAGRPDGRGLQEHLLADFQTELWSLNDVFSFMSAPTVLQVFQTMGILYQLFKY